MNNKLKNKVAIITGASKGIGASIAKHFAEEGAKVVVNYASSKEGADKVVKAITDNGGRAIAVQGDVSKEADVIRLFEETKEAFGTLDILVNNSATKAAIDAVTIALSKELGAKNIRINSILPGATETEGARSAGVTTGSEYEKMFIANTPLGRRGQPEDIAKAAVFLASDDAAWITGDQISVSGGMYGF